MTPYTDEHWKWVAELRRSMCGYWVSPSGALHVTFYTPSRWERFCAWWTGWNWEPYSHQYVSDGGK